MEPMPESVGCSNWLVVCLPKDKFSSVRIYLTTDLSQSFRYEKAVLTFLHPFSLQSRYTNEFSCL